MHYLKIFTDFEDAITPLGDPERGRLFTAMLHYARTGEELKLTGNERIIWPTAKANIDREVQFIDKQRSNGQKGGRPAKTQINPTKPNESQKSQKDKDNEKDNDNDKKIKKLCVTHTADRFPDFWASYPKKVAKPEAQRAWNKLKVTDDLADLIINDVEQKANGSDWARENGRYIPYPATYLNQHRWEDEGVHREVGSLEKQILREWGEEA